MIQKHITYTTYFYPTFFYHTIATWSKHHLKFYKITYFLADLQAHHLDVHIAAGIPASFLNLFAQSLNLGSQLIVAGCSDGLHPIAAIGIGSGGQTLLETVLEFYKMNKLWKLKPRVPKYVSCITLTYKENVTIVFTHLIVHHRLAFLENDQSLGLRELIAGLEVEEEIAAQSTPTFEAH